MAISTPDSKERFSNRVDGYVAARPRYPHAVIDYLRQQIGLHPSWTVADIGSGTGISTGLFLENGNTVYAIEPNAPMRNAAEKSLSGFAKFHSVNASAEATTLPDHSVDLIAAAQAFHWFDIDQSRAEFKRILHPRGFALLMWNNRKLGGSPFLDAYENLLKTFGTDYLKVRHNNIDDAALSRFFGSPAFHRAKFPNHQHLNREGLRARLLSSSYVPHDNQSMLDALDAIFTAHQKDAAVTIEYETELFFAALT